MITQQMSSGSLQVLDIRRSLYLHRLFSPGGVGILSLFIAATGPMALALAFARRLRHGALSALMKPSYLLPGHSGSPASRIFALKTGPFPRHSPPLEPSQQFLTANNPIQKPTSSAIRARMTFLIASPLIVRISDVHFVSRKITGNWLHPLGQDTCIAEPLPTDTDLSWGYVRLQSFVSKTLWGR
ncbi:hypothetical protein BXZ70DRAFT_166264 [Cristinia sonorae]|uniref:Uncharacterized protein n=1 Tax=Cristinia sonorae TaxID=1940300 RepID=A0A8K0UPQ1_9AGAR|nr:hypothetical protein BXZ70DRAFT_166264 [Cristinia sonorae]